MRHTRGFALKGGLLFLASTNVIQQTRAQSLNRTDCSVERESCLADPACLQCEQVAALAGGGDFSPPFPNGLQYTECLETYPDAFTYAPSESAISCENEGAIYCCTFFGDADSAQSCMSNDAATTFWGCLMQGELPDFPDCSVYDMPCHPESTGVICKADLLECEDDAVCNWCLSSRSASFSGDCSSRYPDVFDSGGDEGGFAGSVCEVTGAKICCEFEDTAFAESCLANAAMASYQACVMDKTDCLPDDIPCYTGSPTSSLLEPSPSSSNVESPTTLYATSSSATDTPPASPLSSAQSPTTLYATSSPATTTCVDPAVACQSDDVCQTCLASLSDTSWNDCRDRYPDLYVPLGGENGISGSFCELAGAEFCCQFEDKVSAARCMENGAMATYYECLMVDEGCVLDEMPCYGDLATTTPSASASAEGARGFDLTPSPFVDTPGTVDPANGATVSGLVMVGSLRVMMLLCAIFLVAAAALF